MSNYKKIADGLTNSLQLSQRPIAMSFTNVPPSGVHAFNGVVPAGCSFWQLAWRSRRPHTNPSCRTRYKR